MTRLTRYLSKYLLHPAGFSQLAFFIFSDWKTLQYITIYTYCTGRMKSEACWHLNICVLCFQIRECIFLSSLMFKVTCDFGVHALGCVSLRFSRIVARTCCPHFSGVFLLFSSSLRFVLLKLQQLYTSISIFMLAVYCLCGLHHVFPFIRLWSFCNSPSECHMSLVALFPRNQHIPNACY